MTADLLLRNVRVHGAPPHHDAVAISGERISWIGIAREAGPAGRVLNAGGALLTPAFVDAHVHATATGIALGGLDLTGSRSLAEAMERLHSFCTAHPGMHVIGHGWDETGWPEGRAPTRHDLDHASRGAVVYLTRIDVHSAIASTALINAVPDLRIKDGFEPAGWLRRDAHHAARAHALESISDEQRLHAQRLTRRRAAQLGIGSFHELGGPQISSPADFAGLLALAAREPGTHVVGYWGELGGIERARELGALGAAGDLFADGAIGSHTACLRAVYADEEHTGAAYLTAAQIRDHVVACTRAGLQAGFHVIGDGAMDLVVAGFREAERQVGVEALRSARHRLEHVEMVDDAALRMLAQLRVYASVQPVFDALWGGTSGMYAERLGRARAAEMNPYRTMSDLGVLLAFGSDSPVTPLDPWGTVRAAVHHRTPQERIPVAAAFAAHTVGGWSAAKLDGRGRISVGAPAYLAVWDVPEFPDLAGDGRLPKCRLTIVAGQAVFHDGSW